MRNGVAPTRSPEPICSLPWAPLLGHAWLVLIMVATSPLFCEAFLRVVVRSEQFKTAHLGVQGSRAGGRGGARSATLVPRGCKFVGYYLLAWDGKSASTSTATRGKKVMSISAVWTAIRGKESAEVLRELGLDVTGVQAGGGLVGALLPSGWYVITVNLRSAEDPCASVLAALSSGCEVVTFGEVESTGYKEAAGWIDGSRTWSVTWDPEQGDKLAIEGIPPAALDSVLRADTEEARAALYDVLELSKSLTGFRPDEGCPGPCEVLAPHAAQNTFHVPKKSSWLKKLFGGK